jgi:uncharacterized membrane protein
MVYVVERYLPGLSRSDLLRGLSRLEQAVAGLTEVRYLGSTIVLEDEACFCQFEASSETAIAEANRQAGLPYDRIVPAVTVTTTTSRGDHMNVSTHPLPGTVQISRSRLLGLVVLVAALAAALTGAVVAVTVGNSSSASATPALSSEVQAGVNNVPLIPKMDGARVVGTSAEEQHVQQIVSLTPEELRAAFGTETETAAALASLTPAERLYVKRMLALTPEQLRAIYGTQSAADGNGSVGSNWPSYWPGVLASLTPAEQRYVESIMALSPEQLRAAFGTETETAATLAALTPGERVYVERMLALTPEQVRAIYGGK